MATREHFDKTHKKSQFDDLKTHNHYSETYTCFQIYLKDMPKKVDKRIVQELKLISVLVPGETFTAKDLMTKIGLTNRTTLYRYIKDIQDAGFSIIYQNKRYGFATEVSKELRKIIYFSSDEASTLYQCVASLSDKAIIKPNLLNKLYGYIDVFCPPRCTVKSKNASNVENLSEAIKERKQVILRDYSSPNSQTVRDRNVEPYEFTTNYSEIWCYDLDDHKNKTFKTTRIGSVDVLPVSWQCGHSHRKGFVDAFHMSGDDKTRVRLRLGVMAYNLLIEEYPLAEFDVAPLDETHWILDTYVANFLGIGRFVIPLAHDIKILACPGLVQYIKDYVSKNLTTL